MLKDFADHVVYGLLGLEPEDHLGQALNFFIYDSIKILILLSVIIFLVAIVRSYFPPERTRRILSQIYLSCLSLINRPYRNTFSSSRKRASSLQENRGRI